MCENPGGRAVAPAPPPPPPPLADAYVPVAIKQNP